MQGAFSKCTIRLVTLLTGIIVTVLGVMHIAYPSMSAVWTQWQLMVESIYLGYIGVYVGSDWFADSLKSREQEAR
jgi:uncharacterized membrane protein HdeD (DUF308 family)